MFPKSKVNDILHKIVNMRIGSWGFSFFAAD